jgi:light-regulated signal transduction histidine kinase (bacteriophytochrome)
MNVDRRSLASAFAESLAGYLKTPDESALSRAYEIGRQAINDGMGLLDIALMYQDALRLLGQTANRSPREFEQAAEFLVEVVAPFEMTIRGYKEANDHLEALTHKLEEQNLELMNATAAAQAANKDLEAFSYSISHDLRTPVRHIEGFSNLLMEKHGSELQAEAAEYVTTIQRSARNMAQMIEDLLNLSRLDRQSLARATVDLNAIAADVIRELQRDVGRRAVEWRIGTLPVVSCDPGLITLVLTNLLSNALKYTRNSERAVIQVGQRSEETPAVCFVKDNGAGFDQQYAGRLFGVFQRLHRADEFEGTGVGLATVERIIRKHGGRIWAEGVRGEGATFYFTVSP